MSIDVRPELAPKEAQPKKRRTETPNRTIGRRSWITNRPYRSADTQRQLPTNPVPPDPEQSEDGVTRRGFWGELAKRVLPSVVGVTAAVSGIAAEQSKAENQPRDPNREFLTADHLEGDANKEPKSDLEAGNLSRNAWEQDAFIIPRLKAYKPSAIYVDRSSIGAIKLDYLYALPSLREWQPQAEYNGKKGVFVIAGDSPYKALQPGLDEKLDAIEKPELDRKVDTSDNLVDFAIGLILTGATGTGAVFSRRKFLGGTAALSALAVLEGNKAFNRLRDLPPNIWLDGRDALADAKSEDGINLLRQDGYMQPDEKSAILMGSAHGNKAKKFMSEGGRADRDKAILDLARYSVAKILTVLKEQYQRELSPTEINHTTARILKNFAAMRIAHVSNPDEGKRIADETALNDYVEANVEYVYPKVKMSDQVVTAIRSLIPPGIDLYNDHLPPGLTGEVSKPQSGTMNIPKL